MIYIFHGDNQKLSRQAFSDTLDKYRNCDVLNLDSKSLDENQISQFLNSQSLIASQKLLCFSGFFSIAKAKLDKIIKLLNANPQIDVLIWQDKTLTAAQLKQLPKATVAHYRADNTLFLCLNHIRPKNLKTFLSLYYQVNQSGLFDLFLYLLKGNLRRWLQGNSRYNSELIKKIYLQTIEMEFQFKSGQLALPRELALERVLLPLLK